MKKMMRVWALVAVAALGLTACQDYIEEVTPSGKPEDVTIQFVSDAPETRTSVDTSGETPQFSWDDEESFVVLEQTDATFAEAKSVAYEKVDEKASITTTFEGNPGQASYTYVTVYPKTGFGEAESLENATLKLPAAQTMGASSYDPAADLMISLPVTTTQQPTEAQQLRFMRLAAVVEMTLKGLSLESGDRVEQVIFTAEGKALAGSVTADLNDPLAFTASKTSESVTVTTDAANNKVSFTTLPATLGEGDGYSVLVVTGKYLYLKKGAIGTNPLEFQAGMVNRFTVNMSTATTSYKWELVKDASTLQSGDIVTVAAKNYNYVIGKQGSSYPYASQTEVVKVGDYLIHPIATADISIDNRMSYYTLNKRDGAFDFYNDEDYEGDTEIGFVHANGTNNSPKLQAYCDVNTLFEVTIAEGAATLYASKIEKTYKWWRYKHSDYASSRVFSCYTSAPTGNNQVCLYKRAGAEGEIPLVKANVTVPDEDVVISEDAATASISTEEVSFNYVGDWKIEVSSSETWLDVAYDAVNNCLTYTAEANTSEKRTAAVTIKATMEGQETIVFDSFNILQKAATIETTIELFSGLAADPNSTYKLTGKIVKAATNITSGGYVLADENDNQVTINYLDTELGENVWGHDDFTLQVGDVVTVTAVPAGSQKGGTSANPAIYKGHYRLEVALGAAAEYTGGDVTIGVSTSSNGNVTAPATITASMVETEGVNFSYSGGDTATVSFNTTNEGSSARKVDVTFTAGLAEVTVTAQQGINPANKVGYELVTNASTLAVGDEVIIVTKNSNYALKAPAKASDTAFLSTTIEKTGNVIYDIEEAGVLPFTIKEGLTDGTKAFEFTYSETTYYLYFYSSGLRMKDSITETGSWTIEIADDGEAKISTVNSSGKSCLIKFNSATSTLKFTTYLSTATNATKAANAICIYKKQK